MNCSHSSLKLNPDFNYCPDCGDLSPLTSTDKIQYRLNNLEDVHGITSRSFESVISDIKRITPPSHVVYLVKHHKTVNRQKKAFLRYRLLTYLKKEYPRFMSRPKWETAFEKSQEGILSLKEEFEDAFIYDHKITEWNKTLGPSS